MRIGLITFSDLGSDARILRQVDAFLGEGWTVDALVMGPQDERHGLRVTYTRIRRKRAGKLRYVFEYAAFGLRAFFWVTWRALRGELDVLYVNSPPDILTLACVVARARRVPVLLDIHDPMPELWLAKGQEKGLLRSALELQERVGVRLADTVITVHEPMRELITSRNEGRDVGIVMNVPDLEIVSHRDVPESRVVVFTGTVAFRYGLDDLALGMSKAASGIPGLTLRVIGHGEDLQNLLTLAESLDLPLESLGRVPWSDVPALQADAWVGANVPKPDALGELSFSNKVVEWVAAGIPVLSSRTHTILSYFPEGTLFYADAGDPESIAETLMKIHSSPEAEIEQRSRMAVEALERIAWPKQRAELVRILRETAQLG